MTGVVDVLDRLHLKEMDGTATLAELAAIDEIVKLRHSLRLVVQWAEALEPYSEAGTHMVPVFTLAKKVLEGKL